MFSSKWFDFNITSSLSTVSREISQDRCGALWQGKGEVTIHKYRIILLVDFSGGCFFLLGSCPNPAFIHCLSQQWIRKLQFSFMIFTSAHHKKDGFGLL